ncbi:hypothetical protein CC2G_014740 [Coprinopsis cinerea AmutBmut pab1-1]|nr:hypothetical protein CC2G_014740 [Coprinopsis cinerea AmutBmut pab1-1]
MKNPYPRTACLLLCYLSISLFINCSPFRSSPNEALWNASPLASDWWSQDESAIGGVPICFRSGSSLPFPYLQHLPAFFLLLSVHTAHLFSQFISHIFILKPRTFFSLFPPLFLFLVLRSHPTPSSLPRLLATGFQNSFSTSVIPNPTFRSHTLVPPSHPQFYHDFGDTTYPWTLLQAALLLSPLPFQTVSFFFALWVAIGDRPSVVPPTAALPLPTSSSLTLLRILPPPFFDPRHSRP